MPWFTTDFDRFFKELAAHNEKSWFDAQRPRYEASVKAPMLAFIDEVLKRVRKLDPLVTMEAKQSVHRIYRDIRFSKDKTPYKTYTSASISHGARKDMSTPGMYLELGPEAVWIYGGAYLPDKEQLLAIRAGIRADLKGFRKVVESKALRTRFGTIQGERTQVLAPEFKALLSIEPLIANKQFYLARQLAPAIITSDDLVKTVMDHYKAMKPMNDRLEKAMRS